MTDGGLFLEDAAATERAGERLAGCAGFARVWQVHLRGDLGAGKTTLVRGLLRGLGHSGTVRSPTYTLVEPYALSDRTALHLDLYRLADPEELEYLGLREQFGPGTLWLVEWPERGTGWLPAPDLVLTLFSEGEGRRLLLAGPRAAAIRSELADL